MNSVWYCTDCETRIEREEIEDHEDDGHHVRGQIRPDRLLGNDPHNVTVLTDDGSSSSDEDDVSGVPSVDGTETTPTDESSDEEVID